jgi:nitrous oxidase accessory protein
MDGVIAHDNVFLGNRIGVYLDNSPSSVDITDEFRGNVFAFNDIGVSFLPSVQRNRFVDNAFLENLEQVAVQGGGNFRGNDFTIDGRGNFWSDYRGYDLDGDGIGDLEYASHSLFENLMDREPKLRLFLFSPAQQAIDMAARAFPIMMPRPKFTDTAPLMTPSIAGAPAPARASSAGLLAVAAGLAGAGVTVLAWGARGAAVAGDERLMGAPA